MKKRFLSALVMLGVQNSYAATFEKIIDSANERINSLSDTILEITEEVALYGDCSDIKAFKYQKSEEEEDINTVKQLMLESQTLMTDYDEYSYVTEVTNVSTFFTAENLLDPTFSYSEAPLDDLFEDEQMTQIENDRNKLAKNIYSLTHDQDNIKIFDGLHSFEDGSWNVLTVMDKIHKEMIVFSVGVCGTKKTIVTGSH